MNSSTRTKSAPKNVRQPTQSYPNAPKYKNSPKYLVVNDPRYPRTLFLNQFKLNKTSNIIEAKILQRQAKQDEQVKQYGRSFEFQFLTVLNENGQSIYKMREATIYRQEINGLLIINKEYLHDHKSIKWSTISQLVEQALNYTFQNSCYNFQPQFLQIDKTYLSKDLTYAAYDRQMNSPNILLDKSRFKQINNKSKQIQIQLGQIQENQGKSEQIRVNISKLGQIQVNQGKSKQIRVNLSKLEQIKCKINLCLFLHKRFALGFTNIQNHQGCQIKEADILDFDKQRTAITELMRTISYSQKVNNWKSWQNELKIGI